MLNLTYTGIEDWESKVKLPNPDDKDKYIENPWCFILGIFMMHTGINNLTEDNAPEFYSRAKLVETCFGGGLMQRLKEDRSGAETVPLEASLVKEFIGLTSNASTYSEAQFYKHLRQDCARELRREYKALSTKIDPRNERTDKVVVSD